MIDEAAQHAFGGMLIGEVLVREIVESPVGPCPTEFTKTAIRYSAVLRRRLSVP